MCHRGHGNWNTGDFCLPRAKYDLSLAGVVGQPLGGSFSFLTVLLNRCDPTQDKCLNETYIQQKLSSTYGAVFFKTYNIDNFNRTNPAVTNNFYDYMDVFGVGLVYQYSLQLQNVLFHTDFGFCSNTTK